MRVIRKLISEEDFTSFTNIVANAYTALLANTEEAKQRYKQFLLHKQQQDEGVDYYGMFQNDKLLAGMRIHYYEMTLYNTTIKIGGVGLVAVDLLHKKERAAKALIEHFLQMFREQNVSLVALYPFRPDFYKKMGFGYGPNIHHYVLKPDAFPKGPTKEHLFFASIDDKAELKACYNRFVEKNHGMFFKTDFEWQAFFKQPENRIVAFQKNNQIQGYLVFSFKKQHEANFLRNNLIIQEFIYETPEALLELSTFLNSQADQVHQIEWTTHDDNVRFFIADARNGSAQLIPSVYHPSSTSGIGLMYRIIHIERFLQQLRTKPVKVTSVTWQLSVVDSFFADNNAQYVLQAKNGFLEVVENVDVDVEVTIEISDLSSLLMGVVTFKELYMYSKLKISNSDYIEILNELFMNFEKPLCMTAF